MIACYFLEILSTQQLSYIDLNSVPVPAFSCFSKNIVPGYRILPFVTVQCNDGAYDAKKMVFIIKIELKS